MAYRIAFKKSVARDLERIGRRDAKRILDGIDADLAADPERFPLLTGQFAGLRKYRVGEYRVIFIIVDKDVLVLRVQHRSDAFRRQAGV
ncbi:MAG: type II toxin-antitoxin system RelE/ParE family toxin [Candidatus Hydrogenedentes bacterium]|nr:type II toxin-antitoxin system RelE/ParE family toxin [Candidatus Hydrogenedentota bacterium]